jgi:AbrB family looped-hinge helix DNA binding protein
MKRTPKFLQTDARGQIVIPKEIRVALGIDENTSFIAYLIDNEGIFLKKIDAKPLEQHPEVKELKEKAGNLKIDKKNIEKAEDAYRKRGGFEEI